jgi:hypothetical protein
MADQSSARVEPHPLLLVTSNMSTRTEKGTSLAKSNVYNHVAV